MIRNEHSFTHEKLNIHNFVFCFGFFFGFSIVWFECCISVVLFPFFYFEEHTARNPFKDFMVEFIVKPQNEKGNWLKKATVRYSDSFLCLRFVEKSGRDYQNDYDNDNHMVDWFKTYLNLEFSSISSLFVPFWIFFFSSIFGIPITNLTLSAAFSYPFGLCSVHCTHILGP